MSFRLPFLASALLLAACGDWEAVPVGADEYIAALNVIAIISPDDTPAISVLVGRTIRPNSPVYSSTSDNYFEDLVSLLRVEDAEVIISAGSEQMVLAYNDDGSPGRHFAEYLPVEATFVPVAGRTYHITVRTLDGLEATGETTVPAAIELSVDPTSSDWAPDDLVTVRWGPTTGHYRAGIDMLQTADPERTYWISNKQAVLEGDTTWTFFVPSLQTYLYRDTPVLPDSYILEIALHAFDDNYRDFFYQGPGSARGFDSGLIMGGNLISHSAYGLTGGVGVVCSYRWATLSLTIRL